MVPRYIHLAQNGPERKKVADQQDRAQHTIGLQQVDAKSVLGRDAAKPQPTGGGTDKTGTSKKKKAHKREKIKIHFFENSKSFTSFRSFRRLFVTRARQHPLFVLPSRPPFSPAWTTRLTVHTGSSIYLHFPK